MPTLSRLRLLFAGLLFALLAGLVAHRLAGDIYRRDLRAAVQRDVAIRGALLDSEIARLRLLPLTLAGDGDLLAALDGDAPALAVLNRKLEALARETGAGVLYVTDRAGVCIAASNWRSPESFVGSDYNFRRYVRQARRDGAASEFAVGTVSRRPGLYFSRRTAAGGIVVVKLEFDRIEAAWRRAGGTSLVADGAGTVTVTSRPAWRFAAAAPPPAGARARMRLPLDGDRLEGRRVVAATVPVQQPGWRLTLFRDARPAVVAARTAAVVAGLAAFAVAVLIWLGRERVRLGRRRTADLEEAVRMRTADLEREINERTALETRAADLREGLRQANRLATLGQVTASVAHETAQPVAAIRTYADTSRALLVRGDIAAVTDNLDAIARLTERIGAVTTQLRDFSRRRPGEVRAIPLADVVDGAMLILKDQLRPVRFDAPPIDPALRVMGGRVRLEQVLVNLVQNAVEAMAGIADPTLTLTVAADAQSVRLTVADSGSGVPADVARRLFTPFVTSRPNGLGLGLVIAHDIMVDLGGTLRYLPGAGGARFEMAIPRA